MRDSLYFFEILSPKWGVGSPFFENQISKMYNDFFLYISHKVQEYEQNYKIFLQYVVPILYFEVLGMVFFLESWIKTHVMHP